MDLKDYILVFDNSLPDGLSEKIVELYKESTPQKQSTKIGHYYNLDIKDKIDGGYFEWEDLYKNLSKSLSEVSIEYREKHNLLGVFPPYLAMEPSTIREFRSENYLRPHVDSIGVNNCKRYLTIITYLNDCEEGIRFTDLDVHINAKSGRMVVFPTSWIYVHEELAPTIPKYTVETYLVYRHESALFKSSK